MNHILSVARKEMRAFFRSPVAIIFLGVYLAFTLATFFGEGQFFARNIADVRPLFSWLPILLIFLCSALTMRQWSEEQKLGTLEVLLTLPVRISHLVVGKFIAAIALVSVALLLTLPIPLMVSSTGDLDLGPVIGGYVGAILLAGAYISIGLFVSALTDNQIVSLIGSVVVCGLFCLVGSPAVVQFFGNSTAEILSAIGTGSRFESIRRGVLDLRDLTYYGTLIATFLTLNSVVLSAKGWSEGKRTSSLRFNAQTTAVLVTINALVLNFVLAGATSLRIDLTERGEYSISDVTKQMVQGLPEPLLIRGYLSETTHPLLAPMVPRIRDVIEEYGIIGGDLVRTEYVDPRTNEEVEKEANQLYGIKSFPFRVPDSRDRRVVNSYFSLLIKYGDEYEILNFDDLIEVQGTSMQNVEVKLRNIEYDLTSAIKKVAYGFQTLEAVFATLEEPAEFTAFITPDTLPENFKEVPDKVTKVLEELKEESAGKFSYSTVNPDKDEAFSRQKLFDDFGFKPFATALLSNDTFYLHMLLKIGDRYERVFPSDSLSEADIRKEIVAALKRGAPGFLKTVGLAKPATPDYSQLPPQMRQQLPPPPPDMTRNVTNMLSETYTVEPIELTEGRVSGTVDVLLVVEPSNYSEKQAFAIDQHLMKGGTVIILGGKYQLDLQNQQGGIAMKPVQTGLEDLLGAYGLRIDDSMVMDLQNEPIAIPVPRDLGGFQVVEMQQLKYPFFADVRSDGMDKDNPVLAGLSGVTVPWASPIVISLPEGVEGEDNDAPKLAYTELLRSSPQSWTQSGSSVQPDIDQYPDLGFAINSEQERKTLAVMVSGSFNSAFKGKEAPEGVGASIIERSPNSARLVVISSSAFASDALTQLSQQVDSNLQMVNNLVDWGLEDTDLLSIRSRGTFARTLLPLNDEEKSTRLFGTAGLCILGLILIIAYTAIKRRNMRPIELGEPSQTVTAGRPQEVS